MVKCGLRTSESEVLGKLPCSMHNLPAQDGSATRANQMLMLAHVQIMPRVRSMPAHRAVVQALQRDTRVSRHCSVQPHPQVVITASNQGAAAGSGPPSGSGGAQAGGGSGPSSSTTLGQVQAQLGLGPGSSGEGAGAGGEGTGGEDGAAGAGGKAGPGGPEVVAGATPFPPCGVMQPQGSILLAAPLCYMYDHPAAVYRMYRAMYCRQEPAAVSLGLCLSWIRYSACCILHSLHSMHKPQLPTPCFGHLMTSECTPVSFLCSSPGSGASCTPCPWLACPLQRCPCSCACTRTSSRCASALPACLGSPCHMYPIANNLSYGRHVAK